MLEQLLRHGPCACGGVAHRGLRLRRRGRGRRHAAMAATMAAAAGEQLSVDELLGDELLQASEVRPEELHVIVPRTLYP